MPCYSENLAQATFADKATPKIAEFKSRFQTLQEQCTRAVAVQGTVVTYRVLDVVNEIREWAIPEHSTLSNVSHLVNRQVLDELKPADMDASNRSPCHPRTRVAILQEVSAFLFSLSDGAELQNVFWLYGLAGSGKSTIATTVANLARSQHRLGAFIFFNRDKLEQGAPARVIRTLAARLAEFDRRIGEAIAKSMQANPGTCQGPLNDQFRVLLKEPLDAVAGTLELEGPIVVVVDALDECGRSESDTDRHEQERESRGSLLNTLRERLSDLPAFIRIVITSRPEQDIETALKMDHVCQRELNIEETTKEDVRVYIVHQLHAVRAKHQDSRLPEKWPGEETISILADRSRGLFVWASTACKFVDAFDPVARLKIILDGEQASEAEAGLDRLYATALDAIGRWDDKDFVESFHLVFGTVFTASRELSRKTVEALASSSPTTPINSLALIGNFGCLVSWNNDDDSDRKRPRRDDTPVMDRSEEDDGRSRRDRRRRADEEERRDRRDGQDDRRRRHEREDSEDYEDRHRDHDRKNRRWSRSKSPRRHRER